MNFMTRGRRATTQAETSLEQKKRTPFSEEKESKKGKG